MDLRELSQTKEVKRHPWETSRLAISVEIIEKYLDKNEALTILDVGCGDTYVVEELSKRFPSSSFYAIDIAFTGQQLEDLQEKYRGTRIHVYSSLEHIQLNGGVSLVLLMDVIEHIENDISFMKWLGTFPFITEKTLVYITVPAFQNLFCSHDVFLGHYRRYDNTLLQRNLKTAGYKKVEIGYFFTSLLFPRIIQVLKEKVSKPKLYTTGLVEWKSGSGTTKIIHSVLYSDYLISKILRKIGIKIPGLSNYIICQKSVS